MSTTQGALIFETSSPINIEKFSGQNLTVWNHLQHSNITILIAIRRYEIYNLHSRISDLRNKHNKIIFDRTINENGTTCKEYSLKPFPTKNLNDGKNN